MFNARQVKAWSSTSFFTRVALPALRIILSHLWHNISAAFFVSLVSAELFFFGPSFLPAVAALSFFPSVESDIVLERIQRSGLFGYSCYSDLKMNISVNVS